MDPDSRPRIAIAITDGRGRPVRVPGLAGWLTRVLPAAARGDLAIALVSNAEIRSLNRRFRGKDAVTDVLSFPDAADAGPQRLGDVAIATAVAKRQAREARHSYTDELKILALHGVLHLMGYDHDAPADRGRMARVEDGLRARGGLRQGLIARTSAAGERRAPAVSAPPRRRGRAAVAGDGGSGAAAPRVRGRAGKSEGGNPSVKK